MTLGRPQGALMLVLGAVLLVAGLLILTSVPSWGAWIAAYPALLTSSHPANAQGGAMVAGFGGAIGPLLQHVGHYVRAAGYFVGSLVTLMSLVPLAGGTAVLVRGAR